jgi:resolvase-like protein
LGGPGARKDKQAAGPWPQRREWALNNRIRVSTDEQSALMEAQREACTPLARQRGYEIVREYEDESVSGAIPIDKQPALKRALKVFTSDFA